MSSVHPVEAQLARGHIDSAIVESWGLLRLIGWVDGPSSELVSQLQVSVDGVVCAPTAQYRVPRPDVAAALKNDEPYSGLVIEYLLPRAPAPALSRVSVTAGSKVVLETSAPGDREPDYAPLFSTTRVLHRADIYSSGPPSPTVSGEVVEIARRLAGPTLDFGCGTGALVKELRARGIEASGIELAREEIRTHLLPEARPYVQLYEGGLPTGFQTGQFETVTSCEVLEHIPNYEAALAELSRLTRSNLLVTVPDMSAVPTCHEHHVVPWHLLEGSHVNFFNEASLRALLQPHFRQIEVVRIGMVPLQGTSFYTSLVAICRR